jgi:hypothetical protein
MDFLYKIYKVIDYKNTSHNDDNIIVSSNINNIVNELLEDKGYHLLLQKNIMYKLFFDIDNVIDEEQFQSFIRFVDIEYDLNFKFMSYTKSISKKGLLSYHIVYSYLHCYLHNMIKLCNYIKNNQYYKENFNGIIDTSVYYTNRWFRLPNQTNQDKPNKHLIIKGKMEDFIYDYLVYDNDEYIDQENKDKDEDKEDDKIKYNIKKTKHYDSFETKFNAGS